MRNKALIVNRQLIALTIALPVFAFTAGCQSTPETPTVQAGGNSGSQAEDMSDASIAARVKAALSADPELRPLLVSVATYRGAVQLSGSVNSQSQADRAVAIARSVKGVQSVGNELQLRSHNKVAPRSTGHGMPH